MSKFKFAFFMLSLSLIGCSVEAAPANSQPNRPANPNSNMNMNAQDNGQNSTQRKDEIMRRDQIDNTDTYAIPLDSSEVEDEEEINRLEGKKVFNLGR